MKKQDYLLSGLAAFAVYLVSTGVSYAFFSSVELPKFGAKKIQVSPTPFADQKNQSHFDIDPSIPKTEECPINGIMYTKNEKEIWINRRPIAAMIENHADSRPQSGLSKADVVYEAVAEGGITRFMGIFYCGAAYKSLLLAPVRSARTYYLPWVLEYDALYNHVGGAGRCADGTVDDRAKALCQIETYKIKDMDQFGLPFKVVDNDGKKYSVCYRNYDRLDHEVATEHTMVCETDGLYKVAEKDRGITNVDQKGVAWDKNFISWKFKDGEKEDKRGSVKEISFSAWSGYENDYGVKWIYDSKNNNYLRFNGGVEHKDIETNQQLQASVVIVMFAKETGPVDDHKHLLYANTGSGDGFLFQDGTSTEIIWKKADKTSRTRFYDKKGKELPLNRGQIWIEMLPIGVEVSQGGV